MYTFIYIYRGKYYFVFIYFHIILVRNVLTQNSNGVCVQNIVSRSKVSPNKNMDRDISNLRNNLWLSVENEWVQQNYKRKKNII